MDAFTAEQLHMRFLENSDWGFLTSMKRIPVVLHVLATKATQLKVLSVEHEIRPRRPLPSFVQSEKPCPIYLEMAMVRLNSPSPVLVRQDPWTDST